MRLLLDSLVLVHIANDPSRIPAPTRSLILERNNQIFLSIASALELQIKVNLGKITFKKSVYEIVRYEIDSGNVNLLPITLEHIDQLASLPNHHRDPFDRLLIAQALCENLTFISSDQSISRYPVPVLWE